MTALAANLMTLLTNIAAGGATAFANPKAPLVKQLERDGYIAPTPSNVDPTDPARIFYAVTAKGGELLPQPQPQAPAASEAPAAPAASEAPAAPAADPTTGTEPIAAATTAAPAATRKPRVQRVQREVIVAHSGKRMKLPANIGNVNPGQKREKYPFGSLAAPDATGYDSFFVKATPSFPTPALSLASYVTKANKKYKDEGRFFKIIAMAAGEDHEFDVAGARVIRIDNGAVKQEAAPE